MLPSGGAPSVALSESQANFALGACQSVVQGDDDAGVLTLKYNNLLPEYFLCGHHDFFLQALCNPQMLELHARLLGVAPTELCHHHSSMLNRPVGFPDGPWHCHGDLGPAFDAAGPTDSLEEYDGQPNVVRTLCFPNGFAASGDGGTKFIAGSHLFRDIAGCRASDDAEMEGPEGWLAGRRHPITGEPLKITKVGVPPGSLVCVLSHSAHAVEHKGDAAAQEAWLGGRRGWREDETRWCSLLGYCKLDARMPPPHGVPPHWVARALTPGLLPPDLARLLVGPPGFAKDSSWQREGGDGDGQLAAAELDEMVARHRATIQQSIKEAAEEPPPTTGFTRHLQVTLAPTVQG